MSLKEVEKLIRAALRKKVKFQVLFIFHIIECHNIIYIYIYVYIYIYIERAW